MNFRSRASRCGQRERGGLKLTHLSSYPSRSIIEAASAARLTTALQNGAILPARCRATSAICSNGQSPASKLRTRRPPPCVGFYHLCSNHSLNGSCCQLARHGVLRVLALLARKATVEIGWPHNGHCQAKALGRQNPTPLLNELLVGLAHWSDVAV